MLYAFPELFYFFNEEPNLLDMVIGEKFMKVNPNKLEILALSSVTSLITVIRSSLLPLQFFRRFIPNIAKRSAPLKGLKMKKSDLHNWDELRYKLFEKLIAFIAWAVLIAGN